LWGRTSRTAEKEAKELERARGRKSLAARIDKYWGKAQRLKR